MKNVVLRGLALVLFAAAAARAAESPAPPSVDAVLDTLDSVRTFRGVAISPDGSRVAWVERRRAKDGMEFGGNAIFVSRLGADAGLPRRVTAASPKAEAAERDLAFSPDGSRLAFLSDAE